MALVAASGRWSLTLTAGSQPGTAPPSRVTIPYLASTTRPDDLEFAAAECEVAADGATMICHFRQVFLTVSAIDASSCAITTNGYDRRFTRASPGHWVSAEPPTGACGLVETTVLDDAGSTHWTMSIGTTVTRQVDAPACRSAARAPEVYDWRAMKRRLPCTFVQPGAIER